MYASIQYNEITSFIERNYKLKIGLKSIEQKELEVSYKLSSFIPQISITLHIENISNDCIGLTYKSNSALELIINGIVSFVTENVPTGVEIDTTARRVKVYPHKFEKLEKALEFVELKDVVFDNDEIKAVLSLK